MGKERQGNEEKNRQNERANRNVRILEEWVRKKNSEASLADEPQSGQFDHKETSAKAIGNDEVSKSPSQMDVQV
jgi:hypothetical protein